MVVEQIIESHSEALCRIFGVWLANIIEWNVDRMNFSLQLLQLFFFMAERACFIVNTA